MEETMAKWIEQASKEIESRQEILSFGNYMQKAEEHSRRHCRPTFHYLLDMIYFFGTDEHGHYRLFERENEETPPIFGQHKVQKAILQNLINFCEEGLNNKLILLVGPNGSSKSSIVRKLMQGAQDYSKTEEGAIYTFSWIFPNENLVKGVLGISKNAPGSDMNSFAHLEDKDISAILNAEMKDHPLLLVPPKYRQNLLQEWFASDAKFFESIKKSYLYAGDLSKRNRMIYDALLKNYKGQHSEVLKHIRVERFEIGRRYSIGAVTIEPQIHVDAQMQQITMDKRLTSLPTSLQSLNLFSMRGEMVLANRGILEYSDLLKRPLESYKYLLATIETKNINLQGVLTELDIFFVGTSNEIHLAAFKQHPDFNSFKGRFNFIKVPYLLDYTEEKKIYLSQMGSLQNRCRFEPHSLESLCLFAVMTRLRAPQSKHYSNKKLASAATGLGPLEKAMLFAHNKVPDRLSSENKQILSNAIKEVKTEFVFENLYEGKFGISPRSLKKILYKMADRHENITFLEVIEYLQRLIDKKSDYDFLNMTPQGDYHHPARFIVLIKNHYLDIFDKELRDSLGMVDNRSYQDYIQRYIESITALIKGEKIKNKVTGQFEQSDSFFIKEFENNIQLKEAPDTFRSHLLSRLGAYSLDHPDKGLDYCEIFPDLMERLTESFRNEQKKAIKNIAKGLVFFENHREGQKNERDSHGGRKNLEQINAVLKNLQDKYGHGQKGTLAVIKQLIKERY